MVIPSDTSINKQAISQREIAPMALWTLYFSMVLGLILPRLRIPAVSISLIFCPSYSIIVSININWCTPVARDII